MNFGLKYNTSRSPPRSITQPQQNKAICNFKNNCLSKRNEWKLMFLVALIIFTIIMTHQILGSVVRMKATSFQTYQAPYFYLNYNKKAIISLSSINHTIVTTSIALQDWAQININSYNKSNNWKINFYNDYGMNKFLTEYYGNNNTRMNCLYNVKFEVEKSDIWRYSILNKYGGYYADTDVYLLQPFNLWFYIYDYTLNNIPINIKSKYQLYNTSNNNNNNNISVSLVIGIENSYWYHGLPLQFTQWTILSRKNNPILIHVINNVFNNMIKLKDTQSNIQRRTGPIVWTKSILEYISQHSKDLNGYDSELYPNILLKLNELNKRGQLIKLYPNNNNDNDPFYIVILPSRAFNYCRVLCNTQMENIYEMLVQHQFAGRWKSAVNYVFEV